MWWLLTIYVILIASVVISNRIWARRMLRSNQHGFLFWQGVVWMVFLLYGLEIGLLIGGWILFILLIIVNFV